MKPIIRPLSVKIRDKHTAVSGRMAFDANQVWNAANVGSTELSWAAIPEVGYMGCGTSAFGLMKELKGIRKERGMVIDSTAAHTKARKAVQEKQAVLAVFGRGQERCTTQTCSCCGCISLGSPKDRADLRIRAWTRAGHDRGINAAKDIPALGHKHLAAGIPVL
ncbi:MAG: hypothetical protein PHU14_03335 [Methylovulum sp.]|nr:hypothetical protein [Methylovulum sp.]